MLWFDVGVKRYTTTPWQSLCWQMLWFDVGVKRYTTQIKRKVYRQRCGLM